MYIVISMFVGMRLGEVFFYNWSYYQNNLLEIILPFQKETGATTLFGLIDGWKFVGFRGLASHGAAISIVLTLIYYSVKKLQKDTFFLLDRIALTIPLAGFFIRLGNFFNSEIYGKETGSDYGVIFKAAGETVARHPTQLYESFSYLIFFFVLWSIYWKTERKNKPGFIFGVFLAVLWSLRFLIEFLKEPQVQARGEWALNTGQWLSIPLVLIGLFLIIRSSKLTTQKA